MSKNLRQDLLGTEVIPTGYLSDDTLLEKLLKNGKLSTASHNFMRALFNTKQHLSDADYRRALLVFYGIFFTVPDQHTPRHITFVESNHHMTSAKYLKIILNKF